MSTATPFCAALRLRTEASRAAAGGADFMDQLMSGDGTRSDYIAMLAQHFFIYEALESSAERMRRDPVAALFISDALTRLPAIEADLAFLLGEDWREQISPLPTTRAYVARIREVGAVWAGGFVAHHYIRYLGDLSGSQIIRGLMQRRFGFDTNGVGFYLFAQIAQPKQFKDTYRAQLDQAPWDEAEKSRVIDEVIRAYAYNTALFEDLANASAAAGRVA